MAPPPGRRRLRRLRQIGDELVSGVEEFLLVDDVVAVEGGAALVPGGKQDDEARFRTATGFFAATGA